MSLRTEEYYKPEDIRCGTEIVIYGRTCQVYDCDDHTRAWYVQNLGVHQPSLPLKKDAPSLQYQPMPAYGGFGTEEDSMGSVKSLKHKAPQQDMKKMFKQDMHILRFNAKLVSTEPDDENREFIISFYCGDDTIQVYEVCDKNSGRIGGKFMERKKHKNPVTSGDYIERDFLIGRTVFLGGFRFQLVSGDEYTEKYMEDNPDVFPESSVECVINKIKATARKYPDLHTYAVELLKKLDKNDDGVISFAEFTAGLRE
jgi:EF-hand domain-containing protein 1